MALARVLPLFKAGLMLHSIKRLLRNQLGARDDKVGYVADCYFDKMDWTLRYLVVDTDWWSPPARILLSPHAFGQIPEHGDILPVNLTRQQIEDSPVLELNEKVTREHEEDYYRHYNWPFYWQGGSLWGPTDFPSARPAPKPQGQRNRITQPAIKADSNLQSARAAFGFPVHAGPDPVGKVADFLVEDKKWQIRYMVLAVNHHWFMPRTLLISTRKVLPIDWAGARVGITPAKSEIEQTLSRYEMAAH